MSEAGPLHNEMVTLKIDGRALTVPQGLNLIEAAKTVGIEIPHFCYHPHLSVAGNCRICQVKVKGSPKLEIACNTKVREGMEVFTHLTSKEVAEAQAAVLEFILINHPLDCTVCDESGRCKLQDYHYKYNARDSRFLENKVRKVKAKPIGPYVILDGERCIACTRCIRFCDEITKTGELGLVGRGDRVEISLSEGRRLDNPLSGTVADLCPVGALTHRPWRFNTRIWFAKEAEAVCPGCSTGCNCRVAVRDGEIVLVRARLNPAVNKEWMCDEGRYGFKRFLPKPRLVRPLIDGSFAEWTVAAARFKQVLQGELLVFVAPDLLLEEYALLKEFLSKLGQKYSVVLSYRRRTLNALQALLISPDYAADFRAAEFAGLVAGDLEASYNETLQRVREGKADGVLIFGQRALLEEDIDDHVLQGLGRASRTAAVLSSAESKLSSVLGVVLPGQSILEKAGLLINGSGRLQYTSRVVEPPWGTKPEWWIINALAAAFGIKLGVSGDESQLTEHYLKNEPRLAGLTVSLLSKGGVALKF